MWVIVIGISHGVSINFIYVIFFTQNFGKHLESCKNFSNHNSNNEKVLIIGLKTLYRLMSWPWTYVVARISKCIHLYTCPLLIVSCLNQLCCFLFRELMQHSSEISDVCSWDNCSEYDLRILCSCMTWWFNIYSGISMRIWIFSLFFRDMFIELSCCAWYDYVWWFSNS